MRFFCAFLKLKKNNRLPTFVIFFAPKILKIAKKKVQFGAKIGQKAKKISARAYRRSPNFIFFIYLTISEKCAFLDKKVFLFFIFEFVLFKKILDGSPGHKMMLYFLKENKHVFNFLKIQGRSDKRKKFMF
jgi:hypothetical protein